MIKYFGKESVIDNPYFKYVKGSTLTNYLGRADEIIDYSSNIKAIYCLLDYGKWNKDIDVLSYISKKYLDFLRSKSNVYLIFDCSLEGWSPWLVNFPELLHNSCKKHYINPNKIILVTSNLMDENNYKKYVADNSIHKTIKLVTYTHFKTAALNSFWDITKKERSSKVLGRYMKLKSKKEYNGKFFLSFSRLNRKHRILASYLLHQNNLDDYGLISQNHLYDNGLLKNEYDVRDYCRTFGISYPKFLEWSKKLPLIIDTADFATNHAHNLNLHIYSKVLFEIVNETLYNDYYETSIFYSEKTFKPIACMTPFLIFGQKNINSKLEDLGYKLYTDMFDYSFDSIANPKQKYVKIIETIVPTIQKLNKMSRQEQLDWKYQNEDILLHNLEVMQNEDKDLETFVQLLKLIQKD